MVSVDLGLELARGVTWFQRGGLTHHASCGELRLFPVARSRSRQSAFA